jgi:hypothetical protein
MKAILLTSDNCTPCAEVKEQFKDLIASGDIEEVNLERQPEEVARLMDKYDAGLPSLLIIASNGELILST